MGGAWSIRRAEVADRPAVLSLLSSSLGWLPDSEHAGLFAWKHDRNPFGPSPAWVAVDDDTGGIVGFRTFLRWEFEHADGVIPAVRAVDTATDAAFRGRGIFSGLTRHALEELRDEGIEFVFNTPNDQSRPGYLRMGWEVVGRVPVAVRPRSLATLPRLVRARQAADLWSQPCDAGVPAGEAIDRGLVPVPDRPRDGRLRTRLSLEFLRWRYGDFAPLGYRALLGPGGGAALVRLRRRGGAVEAAVGDILSGHLAHSILQVSAAAIPRSTGADYALAAWARPLARAGYAPLPGLGPVLTWRSLGARPRPPLGDWQLALGDVELF